GGVYAPLPGAQGLPAHTGLGCHGLLLHVVEQPQHAEGGHGVAGTGDAPGTAPDLLCHVLDITTRVREAPHFCGEGSPLGREGRGCVGNTTPTLYNLCTIFGFLTPSLIGFLLLPHFFLLALSACFTPLARILSCLFYFFLFLLVCVCMCRYRQVWGTPSPTG